MLRLRTLQVLLVLVGVALIAGIYPLAGALSHPHTTDISTGDQMILGIYFPIGIFLLVSARNPSSNRTLISCFGWSTLAHMIVMMVQAFQSGSVREDLPPQAGIALISVLLIALAPRKQSTDPSMAVGA